jgi:hypothetical protein
MPDPDHPFDLAQELRKICEHVGGELDVVAMRLSNVIDRIRSPDLPNEARELTFRVCEVRGQDYFLCALANNVVAARAAFDAYVEMYPNREWKVRWGMMTPAHYVPKPGLTYDPVPPRTIG